MLLLLACATSEVPPVEVQSTPTVEVLPDLVYTLRAPDPATQMLVVEASVPAGEVSMPRWTPGSYKLRDYARHVQDVEAFDADGQALTVTKVDTDRWHIEGEGQVGLRYRVWCGELGVRTNWMDDQRLVLNGAPTFLVPDEDQPLEVRLDGPWPDAATQLVSVGDFAWRAANHEELVDSPLIAGDLARHSVGDAIDLVHLAPPAEWDQAQATQDVAVLVEAQNTFFGGLPVEDYVFLNVIGPGRGGLEHARSTLVIGKPFAMTDRGSYIAWLGLMSHEYFHTWNAKALRPVEFQDYDLAGEQLTRSLWVVEGWTTYYSHLLLVRAGLETEDELLTRLGEQMTSLGSIPGREVRSLSDTSLDAWIEHYQPDAHSVNSTVSYYLKGAVAAFVLDMRIREASGGKGSLDDVMRRLMAEHYEGGFRPEDVRRIASEVAGEDLNPWFEAHIDGTEPLDIEGSLDFLGLQAKPPGEDDEPAAWLGVELSGAHVTRVRSDGPAWGTVMLGDELVAVDGWRESGDGWTGRYEPEQTVTLTLTRQGQLIERDLTLGVEPLAVVLEPKPKARPLDERRRADWLAP